MWDITGIDTHKETVVQKRPRKNATKFPLSKDQMDCSSRRSSVLSLNAIENQERKPTLLNLFVGGKKRRKSPKRENPELLLASNDEKVLEAAKWVNELSEISPDNIQTELETSQFPLSPQLNMRSNSDTEPSSASDAAESIFSRRTGRSEKTQSTWRTGAGRGSSSKSIPPFNLNSIASKKTETINSPREIISTFEAMSTIFGIEPAETTKSKKKVSKSIITENPGTIITKNKVFSDTKSKKSLKQNINQTKCLHQTPQKTKVEWIPPESWEYDAWECITNDFFKLTRKYYGSNPGEYPVYSCLVKQKHPAIEITYLRRSIRRMEAATPKITLERLSEEWNGIADASIYRELELEKKLWMLTAMRGFEKSLTNNSIDRSSSGDEKVLSLYENYASASTLSALTTAKEVHHLAVTPLSPRYYPNLHACIVPNPMPQLPYSVNEFSSIFAFCIPSLFPASSIPELLRECNRILIPPTIPPSPTLPAMLFSPSTVKNTKPTRGGSLYLTIIDPTPVQSTIGPKLAGWLDQHLIVNLGRQFRCTNPSRLFPVWLADAGFDVDGSKNEHVRFLATVPTSVINKKRTKLEESEVNEITMLQLKSIVGRLLWKDMWGYFVDGEKWWWEDEEIVNECECYETCWEYCVIEAFKSR